MVDGSVSMQSHSSMLVMYQLLMIYFSDGAINPPHFYVTDDEAQRALFYYTGMTKHPRLPPIDRSRIRDASSPFNVREPSAALAAPASSAALVAPVTPTHAPSPAEDRLARKFPSPYS